MNNNQNNSLVSFFKHKRSWYPAFNINIFNILEYIKHSNTFKTIATHARYLKENDIQEYKKYKDIIPGFTMSVACKHRKKIPDNQKDNRLKSYSSIIQVDIDHINKEKLNYYKELLCNDKHCIFCFISLSGEGIKAGFKVGNDYTKHNYYFQQVFHYIKDKYNIEIDKIVKNLYRLCYISFDADLYKNYEAQTLEYKDFTFETDNFGVFKKNDTAKNAYNSPVYKNNHTGKNFQNLELEKIKQQKFNLIATMLRNAAIGTRHATRLKASTLLGGYVASGLCNQYEAFDFIINEAKKNTTNVELAYNDIVSGYNFGLKHPIPIFDNYYYKNNNKRGSK